MMKNLKKKKYHFCFELGWFLNGIYNDLLVGTKKPWDSFPYRSEVVADLSVDNLRVINSTRPIIRVKEEAFDFGSRLVSQMFDPNFEPTQNEELTFGFVSNCISDSDFENDFANDFANDFIVGEITLALTNVLQIS